MYQNGLIIDDLSEGEAALMVWGICRERYPEERFKELNDELELHALQAVDPEAAQELLNAKGMQD